MTVYYRIRNLFLQTLFYLILFILAAQTAYGASISLIWDANDELDLKGYRIYYGTFPGSYGQPVELGKVASYELTGLIEGVTYYISLTAYDTSNNESEKTDEVWGIAKASTVTLTTSTIPISPTTSISPDITTSTVPATTSTPPVTTTIFPDITPPRGTIIIKDGDNITHSPSVILTLFATDNDKELLGNTAITSHYGELKEGALMTFSNDNNEWSDPEPYTTTKTWELSPGEGDKTVLVKFRDAAGNWMIEPAKDQIIFEAPEDNCDTLHKLQPVSIEASSEFLPFCRKTNVADKNHRSLWSTALTLLWQSEFITLDFGEIKQISRIDMYASKLFNRDLFPLSFKIQISNDNLNWEEMHTENNYKLQSVRSASWDIDSYQTRYIRIYITKAKTFLFFFYLAQIAEIEVYGCDIPEQNLASGDEDEKSEDNNNKDETGDVIESDQGLPGVPGKPVIIFY